MEHGIVVTRNSPSKMFTVVVNRVGGCWAVFGDVFSSSQALNYRGRTD